MRHRPRHPLASYPLCSDISSLLQDTWTSALSQPHVQVRVLRDSRRAQEQGKPAAEMDGRGSHAQDRPSSHDNGQRCWLCLEGVSFPTAGLHLRWKLKSSFHLWIIRLEPPTRTFGFQAFCLPSLEGIL